MNPLKWTLLITIIIIGLLIIVDVSYFLSGSFDLYPTEEQENKVKLVAAVIFLILLIIEAILVKFYRKANT